MLIRVSETQIEYLKDLCKCFNQMTAYVHEGVHITVDKDGGSDDHDACRALCNFVDRCVYPETMDMLSDIEDQLKDTIPDPKDLKVILDRAINDWFYMKQDDFGIKDGAEPLDSDIHALKESLVNECERVLEWQKAFAKPDNYDVPLGQFYSLFNNACCTCSGNLVTSYEMEQHSGDAPVEGFFEAWDSMVRAIKDRDREAVLYLGYKLHNLINSMDTSIYDYKHGTWIDDYINWYLEEVK